VFLRLRHDERRDWEVLDVFDRRGDHVVLEAAKSADQIVGERSLTAAGSVRTRGEAWCPSSACDAPYVQRGTRVMAARAHDVCEICEENTRDHGGSRYRHPVRGVG
jgi:hypothetical protein